MNAMPESAGAKHAATLSPRINGPISTAELERRWHLVRAAMEEAGLDVLVMQNNNDHMGGYVKYFTDEPATNGYPKTVIFERDGGMALIQQGPFGKDEALADGDSPFLRGVTRQLTTPSYASVPYSAAYDAELAEKVLRPYGKARVGLVGTYQMSHAVVDHLRRGALAGADIVEASDLVDDIKCVKSAEELERIRATALQQDEALQAAFEAIEPGMRESDVSAIALKVGQDLGSEQGIYLTASFALGSPVNIDQRHHQNRTLEEGDVFLLLVENNGIGGYYTEIGRTCVLGPAPQQMKEELEVTLEAQRHSLGLLRPGASCPEIWNAHNAWLEKRGRPEESRLYCHGQGYDLVERPLVRIDEPMPIKENMNIVCHPGYVTGGFVSWICDNYIIGPDGPGECLHKTPQKIFEK